MGPDAGAVGPALTLDAVLASVHPTWAPALEGVAGDLATVLERVAAERDRGIAVLPAPELVLRAFTAPLPSVRVLLLGQDPYPRPQHAVGLSFSVPPATRPLPGTLRNLLRELSSDTGAPPATTGDLTPWLGQGVLLLNRVLTVRAGDSASHRRIGWQSVTDAAVAALADRARRGSPLVSVLWGRQAGEVADALRGTAVITGVHPSPLSASRGFFGSRPFSRANEALAAQGAPRVHWGLG